MLASIFQYCPWPRVPTKTLGSSVASLRWQFWTGSAPWSNPAQRWTLPDPSCIISYWECNHNSNRSESFWTAQPSAWVTEVWERAVVIMYRSFIVRSHDLSPGTLTALVVLGSLLKTFLWKGNLTPEPNSFTIHTGDFKRSGCSTAWITDLLNKNNRGTKLITVQLITVRRYFCGTVWIWYSGMGKPQRSVVWPKRGTPVGLYHPWVFVTSIFINNVWGRRVDCLHAPTMAWMNWDLLMCRRLLLKYIYKSPHPR